MAETGAVAPPAGIQPLFIREKTCESCGLKTGEGVNDLVEYKMLLKADLVKEIQTLGVMSDFEVAKKNIDSYPGEELLIIIDKGQKYGETFLLCFTEDAKEEQLRIITEAQEALQAQLDAQLRAEEEKRAEEEARLNVVYEDKPISPRPWVSADTASETEQEITLLSATPGRELLSISISRPKRFLSQKYQFYDKNAESGGLVEFRAYKDPNFRAIKENDIAIQVAPLCSSSEAQTTWYRSVNKAIQYESAAIGTEPTEGETLDKLLGFLERTTVQIEHALQQNESVDIFHETFRLMGDDDTNEGVQAENELRELKNFADPAYSKFKSLAAIDWVPKAQGLVAVSAVRNISFDQRVPIIGQTNTSYVLLWDFRLLVKPLILMQAQHEIFCFRFNRIEPNLVAGGCLTGQVVLWDISTSMTAALKKNNRGSGSSSSQRDPDEEDIASQPVPPKFVSSVEHSHKKCVSDLFWLPPTTQINYRGQIVGDEHLDGKSYQFVTVAGDGLIMVWDIRYEQIFNDELRHIARPKHIPTEKSTNKESGGVKPLWGPIFRAHLKRLEGVGELSLCRVCPTANLNNGTAILDKPNPFAGDSRSQFVIATEEGDVIYTDLNARAGGAATGGGKDDDDDDETEVSCVKWIIMDHPRPSVSLQESPFFPHIVLSVSDWSFHLWKVGENKPLFVSPLSNTYLTAGAWSNTRPAVLYIACADGQILVWDFTDSSFRPSIELKATHSKITSMEFLNSTMTTRYQLLAVGDDLGTLHIFEVPRNLTRPVHKEDAIMQKFLERELQRMEDPPALVDTEAAEVSEDAAYSRVGTADGVGGGAVLGATATDPLGATGGTDDIPSAEELAMQKEEEEFLKLESIFISELGLTDEQLPEFATQEDDTRPGSVPDPNSSAKRMK